MNEITLTDNEQNELEKLTKDAQRNTTEAQRFAIEAAKVLSVTQERLKDYKDRGFFKRCWYAVSGKTSELGRANQADLIKMQKFAWMYLAKLQEQNLIQARAIAVIRNNLKELQGEIAEGDIIKITTKTGNKTVMLQREGITTNIINRLVSGSTWLTLREG